MIGREGLAGPLGQLDNLNVTTNVYVVRVERGEEDKLKLPVRAGVVDDVLQGNLPIHGVHEHVNSSNTLKGGVIVFHRAKMSDTLE